MAPLRGSKNTEQPATLYRGRPLPLSQNSYGAHKLDTYSIILAKRAPRGLRESAKRAQEAPETAQEAPKTAQ